MFRAIVLTLAISFLVSDVRSQRNEDTTSVDIRYIPGIIAKSELSIGVTGGFDAVWHSTYEFPVQNGVPGLTAKDGSGSGFFSGIAVGYLFSSVSQHRNGITLTAIYDSKPAQFESQQTGVIWGQSTKNGVTADSSGAGMVSADLSYWTVWLAYKYEVLGRRESSIVSISAGPSFGVLRQHMFHRDIEYLASSGIAPNPLAEWHVKTDSDLWDHHNRLSIIAMLSWDIPLSEKIGMSILAGYDYAITKVVDDMNWRANSLIAGLQLRYVVTGDK